MSVRVYVAATLDLLAQWHEAGSVPAGATRVLPPGDDEDSEYAALMTAADESRALLAGSGRRVVLVAEAPGPDGEGALPWADVVAVHVDTDDDADPDDDLAWFASQEVPHLL